MSTRVKVTARPKGPARGRLAPAAAAPHRIIASEADLSEGVADLVERCRIMRKAHALAGMPPLRRNPAGFLGLARVVVFQQVSTASGNAIWTRVQRGIEPFHAERVLALDDEALRGLGLSRPKVRTLRAVAEAIAQRRLDLDALAEAPDDDIRTALTTLHGIGPWTADIYLMFCLGRADTFAPGDLALQEAVRIARRLETRPTADELAAYARRWRPWRSVAARLLWAYYAAAKSTSGGAPA